MSDMKHKFKILYRDLDPGCPTFVMHVLAYDRDHAEEKFWDSNPEDYDWEILDIEDTGIPALRAGKAE
jgi:hypothetical protein